MSCRRVCAVLCEGGAFLTQPVESWPAGCHRPCLDETRALHLRKTNQINSIYMLNWRKVHFPIIKKKNPTKDKTHQQWTFRGSFPPWECQSVRLTVYVTECCDALGRKRLPAAHKIKIPKWNPSILFSFPSLNWIEKCLREVPAKIMWGCVA